MKTKQKIKLLSFVIFLPISILIIWKIRYFFLYALLFKLGIMHPNFDETSHKFVQSIDWEYGDGYKIKQSSYVIFNDNKCPECNFFLKKDTIYFKNEPKAIIVFVDTISYEMIVTSLKGWRTSSYVSEYNNYGLDK